MIVATLMRMPLKILFKIIRARWDIENSIFNNLKSKCGLEHYFVHGASSRSSALFNIYCIQYNAIIFIQTTDKTFYNPTRNAETFIKRFIFVVF